MDLSRTDSIDGRSVFQQMLYTGFIILMCLAVFLITSMVQFTLIACADLDTAIAFIRSFWFLILSIAATGTFLFLIRKEIWIQNTEGNTMVYAIDNFISHNLTEEQGNGTKFILFGPGASLKPWWILPVGTVEVEREPTFPYNKTITAQAQDGNKVEIRVSYSWRAHAPRLSLYLQGIKEGEKQPDEALQFIGDTLGQFVEEICAQAQVIEQILTYQSAFTDNLTGRLSQFAKRQYGIEIVGVAFVECDEPAAVIAQRNQESINKSIQRTARIYMDDFGMSGDAAVKVASAQAGIAGISVNDNVFTLNVGNPALLDLINGLDPATKQILIQAFARLGNRNRR